MITGVVDWFNDHKGYGQIITDVTNESIFVYQTAIQTTKQHLTLAAGQKVQFQIAPGFKGLQAVNVSSMNK